jgi:hypothetical protein
MRENGPMFSSVVCLPCGLWFLPCRLEQQVLAGGGRAGHFGLPGMHERAKLVGGKLAVWSKLESGTEAELTIPASVAYAKSAVARRSMFWRKGA